MRWIDWFGEVCRLVHRAMGLSPLDLPDVDWAGMHTDELTPEEAVAEAAEEWGIEFGPFGLHIL